MQWGKLLKLITDSWKRDSGLHSKDFKRVSILFYFLYLFSQLWKEQSYNVLNKWEGFEKGVVDNFWKIYHRILVLQQLEGY